jgi:hypothetical protein
MSNSDPPTRQKRVSELEVGMVVARPIHAEDGSRLMPEGTELSVEDIDRLKQWDVRRVHVECENDKAT